MPDLVFQTIQVSMPVAGSNTGTSAVAEAGFKILAKGPTALNGFSLSWRVNQEIKARKAQILKLLQQYEQSISQSRADIGVLVIAAYQEWEDPTGLPHKAFLNVDIVGAGRNAREVLRKYLCMPRAVQGAAGVWARKEDYVWASRP